MHLTLIDGRTLGVGIVQPAANKYLNWSSGAWETPFDGANHTRPLAPIAASPDPNSVVQTVDMGEMLATRPDTTGVIYAIDSGGGAPTYTPVQLVEAPLGLGAGTVVVTRL